MWSARVAVPAARSLRSLALRALAAAALATLAAGGAAMTLLPGASAPGAAQTQLITPQPAAAEHPVLLQHRSGTPALPGTGGHSATSRPPATGPAAPQPSVTSAAKAQPATTAPAGPVATQGVATPTADAAAPIPAGYGCGPALAWLSTHSAPGFTFECPGYALGHQAMTCVNIAGVCPGERLIAINDPCPAAYMNEAHNSWVVTGMTSGPIDPYGYCHS